MKRLSAFVLVFALVFVFSGCQLLDSSLFYSEDAYCDGVQIYINKAAGKCFVGQYNSTEYTENMEITIPDYCEGVSVTTIGGYYGKGVPTPFVITVADVYMNSNDNMVWNFDSITSTSVATEYEIAELEFVLNIGENVSEIRNVNMDVYYPHINDDGSTTFYHPVVYIECDEDNRHFYSDDGKLYDKKTDELIVDFAYKS